MAKIATDKDVTPAYLRTVRTSAPKGAHVMVFCPDCGSEGSADPSDYFLLGDNEPLLCCGESVRVGYYKREWVDL